MVWRATKKVGFGVRGKFVAAWYCYDPGNAGPASTAATPAIYKDNVRKDCLVDGVDQCYLEIALKAHNAYRAKHKEGQALIGYIEASKRIQAGLDAAGSSFDGSIRDSETDRTFENCAENVYEAPSASTADLEATRKTAIAVDTWYDGQQWYDYATGKPRDLLDVTKVKLSNQFANVVWAATTKVGFGVKGKWVVAWYCDAKATPAETSASLQNIGVVCRRGGMNTCLNDVALNAHNAARRHHNTPPLALDETIAKELQLQMDEKTDLLWKGVIDLCEGEATTATNVKGKYLCPYTTGNTATTQAQKDAIKAINKRCMDNVFEMKDETKLNELVTKSVATDSWYAGKTEFNYLNGEPMAWNEKARYAKYQDFTRMMWKKATKVGFGVRGKFVIARYCDDNMSYVTGKNLPQQYAWPFYPWPLRPAADPLVATSKFIGYPTIKKNVGGLCMKDVPADTSAGYGYNACYNAEALLAHNNARARLEGYVPLELDLDMAKTIQALVEVDGFSGSISSTQRGIYGKCGENVFGATDLSKLSDVYLTDLATNTWFEGRTVYDFAAGRPNAGSNAADTAKMEQFQKMVWKGATKVAFGVKDRYVVAWYCVGGDYTNPLESRANIGKLCDTTGYDGCYNELALAAHNQKRNHHETADLALDADAARAIQLNMNKNGFAGLMPKPTERNAAFSKCNEAVYYDPTKAN